MIILVILRRAVLGILFTPCGPRGPSQNPSLKRGPKAGPKNKSGGQVAQRHPTEQVWRCGGMKEGGGKCPHPTCSTVFKPPWLEVSQQETCCLVIKSHPTRLCPMDCSPLGSSICGISQARILEWVAIPFSKGSSQPRDQTCVFCTSCIGRKVLYH